MRLSFADKNNNALCAPSKIIACGLNYIDHAKELNMALPKEPIIFLKPPTTIIGPNENIIYPNMSKRVDYEGELAIVIGKTAKNIQAKNADEYILGYSCANDVTARDLQEIDGQWSRAKSFDTFCPVGPWIETELDPNNLKIELTLNGITKQSSNTNQMLFKPNDLVAFISQIMTLYSGDIILTGTPPGVGPMQPSDFVKVSIEGIGDLCNNVV